MKARYWLLLASFLTMLDGVCYISIYFIQYLLLGYRVLPKTPLEAYRSTIVCLVYGGNGIVLLLVGFLGIIFRENTRRIRFLMTMGILLFVTSFGSGMVNYLVLLWNGQPLSDAVKSVIASLPAPIFFIHTTYLCHLEQEELMKYEDL